MAGDTVTNAQGWQDIATAPKDGLFLIRNRLGQVCPVEARGNGRIVRNMVSFADWEWGELATHWMPLPAPDSVTIPQAEYKRLVEDSARLDWLSHHGREMTTDSERFNYDTNDYFAADGDDTWTVGNNREGWFRRDSIRQAIDAALKAAREGGKS